MGKALQLLTDGAAADFRVTLDSLVRVGSRSDLLPQVPGKRGLQVLVGLDAAAGRHPVRILAGRTHRIGSRSPLVGRRRRGVAGPPVMPEDHTGRVRVDQGAGRQPEGAARPFAASTWLRSAVMLPDLGLRHSAQTYVC
jgi:hypothetical protein